MILPIAKLPRCVRRGCLAATLLPMLAGCATTAYDRGRRALEEGDVALAIQELDRAVETGDRVAEARRERGAAHLEAGRLEAAREDLEAARQAGLEEARLFWLLGRTYGRLDRPADAADAYRAYEQLTSRRSVRKQTRLKVAQLETQAARQAATTLLRQRSEGVEPDPSSVAVYAFVPEEREEAPLADQKICRALGIWVSADLAKVSGVRAIAADQLEVLYAEQGFTYDNRQYFSPASLVAAGNLQPARHMVLGLYGSRVGDQIVMGAACYDAVREATSACSNLDGRTEDLFDLETRLVLDILGALDVTPTAQERIALGEKPTRNLQAFLAFADGVYLRDIGSLADAAAAFHEAAAIDPGFSMALEAEAEMEFMMMAEGASIEVAPPQAESQAEEQAVRSASQLGLGLIPDEEGGDAQSAHTTDVVAARGPVTVRVRATAGSN